MRTLLIFVGAAVLAWLLALGIRAALAGRRGPAQPAVNQPAVNATAEADAEATAPNDAAPERPPYRIK